MGGIALVGMDVHKATVAVAVAEGIRGGEVRQLGIFPNRAEVADSDDVGRAFRNDVGHQFRPKSAGRSD